MIRTYSELSRLKTFEERFRYLSLRGVVGEQTFGSERYVNQQFYRSRQWKLIRDQVIIRDEGRDLGFVGREIYGKIIIHHMNPMTAHDIVNATDDILNPEFLICVTLKTHNAIHYGDEDQLEQPFVERTRGDTQLWSRRSS